MAAAKLGLLFPDDLRIRTYTYHYDVRMHANVYSLGHDKQDSSIMHIIRIRIIFYIIIYACTINLYVFVCKIKCMQLSCRTVPNFNKMCLKVNICMYTYVVVVRIF